MNFRYHTFAGLLLTAGITASADDDLGRLSANPYDAESTSNPYGAGSPYNADSINNPYGRYGSEYSNDSANNPYATNAPKLYDDNGNYRGRLSANPYDPESTSNPYGQYGSEYSPDSINNPYGAGSRYRADSPNNPYGRGLRVYGQGDGGHDDAGTDATADDSDPMSAWGASDSDAADSGWNFLSPGGDE